MTTSTKWEYMVGQDIPPWMSEAWLNSHGDDGWECYAVQPYEIHDQPYVYLYLKRKVRDE